MTILVWEDAQTNKPPEDERVLLKIDYEEHPVVGFWYSGRWHACTANIETSCGLFCQGGMPTRNFSDEDVLQYARLGL